jgi:hypothetical protein
MAAVNLREAKIVARFDYRNLVRSAPGVTFLVLYLYAAISLGAWLADMLRVEKYLPPGSQVSAEQARLQLNTMLAEVVRWFIGDNREAVRFLVFDRPVAMSAFFLLSLLVMPILVQFLAFNQVSGYVSRRSIRFIVPKTGRMELYLGLFASNLIFFTLVSGALTALMTIGWVLFSTHVDTGLVVVYSLRILVAVWLSCVPIIAFMSMIAAMTGSPVATVFLGAGIYGVLDIAGHMMSKQTEWGRILFYVLPLEPKYWFAHPGVGHFLGAAALMLAYTVLFLGLGSVFLRRRNL